MELQRTRGDLAKATTQNKRLEAELALLRAESQKAKDVNPPATRMDAPAAMAGHPKKSLLEGGIAVFPDGKKEQFTRIIGVRMEGGGIFVTQEFEEDYLLIYSPDRSTRKVPLNGLVCVKFGTLSDKDTKIIETPDIDVNDHRYCTVELEGTDGTREKFYYSRVNFDVRWKNKVAVTQYRERQQYRGMSFSAE
jgi:hypothetical protein